MVLGKPIKVVIVPVMPTLLIICHATTRDRAKSLLSRLCKTQLASTAATLW